MAGEAHRAPPARRLRFGAFELDTAAEELFYRGNRVHVQEMPLKVLALLLERPGELVRREELFERLWPDDELGILDDNLNVALHKLRVALGDEASRPNYIETVPRKGYRFIAPVYEVPDEPLATSETDSSGVHTNLPQGESVASLQDDAPEDPLEAGPRFGRPAIALAVVALLALTLGAYALLQLRQDSGEAVVAMVQPDVRTIAVLPFLNLSDEPGQEYFSDGLTEELIDRLARPERLRVVSRTSSFALRDADLDAREIGRMLGTEALVEGSVRRDGNRLRITAQLVDAKDGYHLWSETYDRHLDDVFAIQSEIATSIAETLQERLLAPAEAEALKPTVIDSEAYDLYLRGRYQWHRRTEAGLRQAAIHFDEAVDRAPEYVPAWVGLGDAYAVLGFYDYLPPSVAFPNARRAARRALELNPDNASAWATLGYVALYYDWDLERGEDAFRHAIDLDPHSSKARQWYANLLTAAGRFEEAEREMRRAQELDPLSLIANAALGWVRFYAGHYESAIEQCRLTLELDPDFELAYLWSGWALEVLGRYDEALEMLDQAVERSAGSGISVASLARLHGLRGEIAEAESLLAGLETAGTYVPVYEIGKAYLGLGRQEEAIAWLERAIEQRSHSMIFLRVDPQLEVLHEHPAFAELAVRVRPD